MFGYMKGEYGGSAFLIVYLIFTRLLAIPAMTAEWTLGRETRKGPIGALTTIWGAKWGKRIGALIVFTLVYPQPWRDNLIRISVGCEDADDIVSEFESALTAV
ncbi:MAG: hypothetical protein HOI35_11880 [Woeseia sp.]|jgi:hypothetical protein|nr:hypothetical protein [Woeseia sp.]MBT6210705.1 hypothetical protein [Woeseia sp.]